jgi:nitrogen-specific signal transduction histidine kinase
MQKASPPASNPLLVLLDLINSPLLLFSDDGHVVFANQAAKQLDSRPALVLGSDPNVRELVKAIAQGKIVTHNELRVEALSDNGIAQLLCRCAPKPIAGLVAMAVTAEAPTAEADPAESALVAPAGDQRLSLQQIMELLRSELLPPVQDVLAHTRATPIPEPMLGLKDSLLGLTERLDRLVDLVDVFGEDVLIGDERMMMVDLVRSTCMELSPLIRSKSVSIVFNGDKDDLPPIYGSGRLIRRALLECVHNAVLHARSEINPSQQVGVEIGFRASGQHLLVSIVNMGALSAAALNRHAASLFKPAALDNGKPDTAPPVMRIGLPLAQHILGMHRGRLRVEQESDQELNVMLELPTGAPRRSTHHLDMLQAQIYAEDLSKLLARGRNRSAA